MAARGGRITAEQALRDIAALRKSGQADGTWPSFDRPAPLPPRFCPECAHDPDDEARWPLTRCAVVDDRWLCPRCGWDEPTPRR